MPEEKIELVPSGMPGLDEMLGGGFERRSSILVSGEAGCGKSTLALQFLHNGIVKYNEPGIYISFEEDKADVYRHMKVFGMDFEKLEAEKKLIYFRYPPHEIENFLNEGKVIQDSIEEIGAKRIVIDSITSFAMLFSDEYKRKMSILNLLQALKKWGCTTLLTSEGSFDTRGNFEAKFGLSYLVDGILFLYNVRKGNTRERAFEVVKMRGIQHRTNICPLMIAGNGIELYPDEPVFNEGAEWK
ncbi:MAG: ATPase domain-containing protein [archaeon]